MLNKEKSKENKIKNLYFWKMNEVDKMEKEMAECFINLQIKKRIWNRLRNEANILSDKYEKERNKNDKSN